MANDVLTQNQSGSRRFAPLGIIFGLLGLLLFAYFVSRAGVGEILERVVKGHHEEFRLVRITR